MFAVQKATKNLVADRIFMLPFLMEPQTKYTLINNAKSGDAMQHWRGREELDHQYCSNNNTLGILPYGLQKLTHNYFQITLSSIFV